MRVAFLIDGLQGIGGGVATYVAGIVSPMLAAGIEPILVGGQPPGPPIPNVPYIRVPGIDADRALLHEKERRDLRQTLEQISPDLVYAHVLLPEAVRVSAEIAPTVFYAHEYLTVCPGGSRFLERSQRFCEEGPGARCFLRAYTERTTNRHPRRLWNAYARTSAWSKTWSSIARVLVASPFVAGVLADDGAPADRISVVPYSVQPPAPSTATRQIDVLYLGRLIQSKGVDLILDALTSLDSVNAVIAGEGPARSALEERAARLGLGDRVEFVGWVGPDERNRLLAGARLLVVPSLWAEPFGIVGVEALGAGVPVLGADVGGISSWLTDGRAGFLFPPGDADALRERIARILSDPRLEQELRGFAPGEAARFSTERHLDLLRAEFDAACNRTSQASRS